MVTRGVLQPAIIVGADSWTGELLEFAGTLTLTIGGGKHRYDLEGTLPKRP